LPGARVAGGGGGGEGIEGGQGKESKEMVGGGRDGPAPAVLLLRRVLLILMLCSPGAVVVVVSGRKVGETCAVNRNCDAGLHCETCVADGNVRPRCTRVAPVDPQTKVRARMRPPDFTGSLPLTVPWQLVGCGRRGTCRSTGTRG